MYFFESCDSVTFQEGNSENYEALAELRLGWGEQSSLYAELKEAPFLCAGPKAAQPHDLKSVSVSFSIHVNTFPGGSVVKNPPAKQETQVWSLG